MAESINYEYLQNSTDIFLRSLFAGVTQTLTNKTKYIQIESDTVKREIEVPFYLRATGQERFLQYHFSGEDQELCEDMIEGSFDVIPRGVLNIEGFPIRTNEITSRFSRAEFFVTDEEGVYNTYSAHVSSIPFAVSCSLTIHTDTQNEMFKIVESLIGSLYWTIKFDIIYKGFIIPALILFPDDMSAEKRLEFSYGDGSMDKPSLTLNLEVQTYLPTFSDKTRTSISRRITKFITNYDVNGEAEVVTLEKDCILSGRITHKANSNPYSGSIGLYNNKNEFIEDTTLEDGYYEFINLQARRGYKIKSGDVVIQKNINLYPSEDKSFDFEV